MKLKTFSVLFLLFVFIVNASNLYARSIHVETAGTLPNLISESEKYSIEELTITGELNGTDFRLLRDMAGNDFQGNITDGQLKVLDISGAKIVAGGEKYLDTNQIKIPNGSNGGNYHFDIQANMIGDYLFAYCSSLSTVILPNSIEFIGNNAFCRCSSLSSITIPNTVTYIGFYAFFACSSLISITIPNSVTYIGYYAFYDCGSLTTIIVESGNTVYDSRNDCNAIIETATNKLVWGCNNTIIPNTITDIEESAFRGCSSLTSITIPDAVTIIKDGTFSGCSGLTSITIPNAVTSIGRSAFSGCSGLTSITIPNAVTSIGSSAFSGCSSLTSITIPDAVTKIEDGTFYGCSGLNSITIPNTVTSIGNFVFNGCSGLISITIPNAVTSIGEFVFENCSSLTSITIPNTVTSIGIFAFSGCSSLTSFTIPDAVTRIEDGTFYDCSSLTSISIPNTLTSISGSAFGGCSSLISITIPDAVTCIEDYTFSRCSGLTSIIIPNSVSSIGKYAFNDCRSLTSITIPDAVTSIKDYTFKNCSSLTSIIIPNTVSSIGKNAFEGCSSLISITIPEAVTSIEEGTFWNCGSLISIKIPNTVSSISGSAFEGCYSLSSITIPDAMTCIEDGTFWGCSGLTSVTIPNTVTSIGKNAFEGCRNLTSIRIPDAVTSIEERTFLGCSSLASITIPNAVTSIGSNAFSDCRSLISITIPDAVTKIEDGTFYNCSGLNSITIPNAVTSIGKFAFSGCSGLTSITIPHAVTSIGESAFSGCRSLTSVISEIKNPFEIEENVFPSDIYTNATLTIPVGTKAQYLTTSSWNKFMTIVDSETSNKRTIHVSTAGTLANNFSDSDKYFYEELTITGELNGTDFRLIRDMAGDDYLGNPTNGRLKTLDLSGARIVEGGEKYLDTDVVTFRIRYGFPTPSGVFGLLEGGFYFYTQTDIIGDHLFVGTSLINIVLPNNVRSIGFGAFSGCGVLNSIEIPNSVTSIEGQAFAYSNGITSITIPNSVTTIGDQAFNGCRNLTTITIPSSVKKMGFAIFANCPELTSIISESRNPSKIESIVFMGINNKVTLYVPYGTTAKYRSAWGWTGKIEEFGTKPDPVIITAKDYTREYGEENPIFDYTASESIEGKPIITCSATKTSPVGTYPIKIEQGSITDDNVSYVEGTLTITPAPLTIMAGNYTKQQGEDNPAFKPTYNGFKNGETEDVLTKKPTITCEATKDSEPGSYVIEISNAEAQNYDITYINGTLTVTDAIPVIITAKSYTREYGEKNPYFEYMVSGAVLEGEPVISCEADEKSPVGTYDIIISKGSVTNSNDTYINGTLTITEAPLTITAKSYTIKQGDDLPTFEALYDGFKNNETSSVLTTHPTFSCSATSTSVPGTYDIIVSDAMATNYDISYINGTLTVTPATYTLTYYVDGEVYKTVEYEYGETIIPEAEPTKEGYTFSGWSWIPETMPAKDVMIAGEFYINSYKLTYMIDNEVYKEVMYEYGATITPEPQPDGNYVSFEWIGLPETMPANDVTVYASYETGIINILMPQGVKAIYAPNGKKLDKLQKGLNIILMIDGKTTKIVVK